MSKIPNIVIKNVGKTQQKLKQRKEFAINHVDFAFGLLSFHFYLLYLLINNILIRYGSLEFEFYYGHAS